MGRATIVCGVGAAAGSGSAIPAATDLAQRLGMKLQLVHVAARAEPTKGSAARRNAALPTDAVLQLGVGSVARTLVTAAERAELLVVGAGRAGRMRRLLGGGVAAAVARIGAVPVLVASAGHCLQPGGVLCGVRDGRDVGPAITAGRLAHRLHVPLTLAHAPAPPAPMPAPAPVPPFIMPPAFEAGRAEADLRMFDDFDRSLVPYGRAAHRMRLGAGSPGQALVRAAGKTHAGLIVVGAPHHGAISGALRGSAAWELLGRIATPLLICPRR